MHGPSSVHGLAPLYGPHQTEQSGPKRATRGTVPCEPGSPTWVPEQAADIADGLAIPPADVPIGFFLSRAPLPAHRRRSHRKTS